MSFTRRAVEELSALSAEPEWLRARRLQAFELFEGLALPDTKTNEEWRRTDLKGLDLASFQPFETPDGAPPAATHEGLAGVLRQRGTAAGEAWLDPEALRQGVVFCTLAEAARSHADLLERYLFTSVRPDRDKFAALHGALFCGGAFLYVPDGVVVEHPLVSQFWSTQGRATALRHTLVLAGKGSRVQLIEQFAGPQDDQPALVSGSAEVFLDDGASVLYLSLQRWGRQAWQFANQRFHLGRDAHLRTVGASLGGRFAKLRSEAILEGAGARADLKGLFFGSGEQAFDFHTLQQHVGPRTSSDLLFKGALRDSARSVYVGLVRVEKNARGTDANQANRNLLLSEHAKAASEPILEIENHDIIRCGHGATVGPVDPEHMFYLQSRGIPRAVAQRMVVQGFLGEILDRIPVPQARELIDEDLSARIG